MKQGSVNEFFWKSLGQALVKMGYGVDYRVPSVNVFTGVPNVMLDLVVRNGDGNLIAIIKFDMSRSYASLEKVRQVNNRANELGFNIDFKYYTWFIGKKGERAEFLDMVKHHHVLVLDKGEKFVLSSYKADEFRSYLKSFKRKKKDAGCPECGESHKIDEEDLCFRCHTCGHVWGKGEDNK